MVQINIHIMIATNIEQSRRLLKLGLDPNTADMVWMFNKWLYSIKDNILHREQFSEQDTLAWSLSALLEVIPKECEPDIQKSPISGVYFAHWFADGKPYITDDHGNAVAAAYEMVCWLLEQGLIEKGDNDE